MTARRVTLTFDNGPTAGVTDDVLDVLAEHRVRATFFVVGRDLARPGARGVLRRAAAAGHWIGNHTMTHSVRLGACDDPDVVEREIGAAQRELGALAHPDRLFRPFGGGGVLGPELLSEAAVRFLVAGGYTCVLWNSVPRDWERHDTWPEACLADVEARDWTVVVLHDTSAAAMRHLPALLVELRRREVEVVQELPAACVPIRRGIVQGRLHELTPVPAVSERGG